MWPVGLSRRRDSATRPNPRDPAGILILHLGSGWTLLELSTRLSFVSPLPRRFSLPHRPRRHSFDYGNSVYARFFFFFGNDFFIEKKTRNGGTWLRVEHVAAVGRRDGGGGAVTWPARTPFDRQLIAGRRYRKANPKAAETKKRPRKKRKTERERERETDQSDRPETGPRGRSHRLLIFFSFCLSFLFIFDGLYSCLYFLLRLAASSWRLTENLSRHLAPTLGRLRTPFQSARFGTAWPNTPGPDGRSMADRWRH